MLMIIIIIIVIISSFKWCFDTIIYQAFNLRTEADEGLCASLYRCYVLDWDDFSESVRGAWRYNFFISCKEGLPGIWSMILCVPFSIIPNAPITTGIIFILSFHILVNSIARSLYFESFWNYFNRMFWSEGTATSIMIQVRSSWFLIIYLVCFHPFLYPFEQWNPIVWLHFLLLLLVSVVARTFLSVWYLIMFTWFPVYKFCYLVVSLKVFCVYNCWSSWYHLVDSFFTMCT